MILLGLLAFFLFGCTEQKQFLLISSDQNLNDLNDVQILSPLNNQALIYQSATGLWINATQAGASGGGRTYSCISPLTCDNDQNLLGLSVSPTSDWNGTFDGQQGTYYLDFTNLANKPPIDTNIFTSGVPDCNSTSFVYGFNSNGTTDCRTDQTGTSTTDTNTVTAGWTNDNSRWLTNLGVKVGNADYNVLDADPIGTGSTGKVWVRDILEVTRGATPFRFFRIDSDQHEITTDAIGTWNIYANGGLTIKGNSGIATIFDGSIQRTNISDSLGQSNSRWFKLWLSSDINALGDVNAKTLDSASGYLCANNGTACYKISDLNMYNSTGGGTADINSNSGFFIGLTSDTVYPDLNYGGFRGYESANYLCDNNYGNSHLCASYEIVDSIRNGDLAGFTSSAWITNGPPGYLANANDCLGFTSSGGTNFGAFWLYDSNGGGSGWLTSCSGKKVLACCR